MFARDICYVGLRSQNRPTAGFTFGGFMAVSRVRTIAIALVASASIAAGSAGFVLAQQSSPATDTLVAAIYAGSCADFGGDPVETLRDLTLDNSSAEFRGLPSAMAVLDSDTELNTGVETFLDNPHALVIGDAAEPVACGDIGGLVDLRDDDEDLDIGIWPVDDSGYFGIAEIDGDDDDDETEISVYIAVPND